MNSLLKILLASALAVLLAGCSNGDDYLYNEEESIFIEVSAEMAYSFDTSSIRVKSDTLQPEDSLIFIANIQPSKAIKIRRYLWTLDGAPLSYDFSFRRNINIPGFHKVVFILETYLGDTLSDTLTLQISNAPVLDSNRIIPARGTQGLSAERGIAFAWNAYDPDSIANISYHFVIDGYVDTIINEQAFTYWGDIPTLSHFNWSVQAINEFGIPSENIVHSDFFTSGGPGESALTGFLATSVNPSPAGKFDMDYSITILDSLDKAVIQRTFASNSQAIQAISLAPLEAGSYRAVVEIPEFADFARDTLEIELLPDEVLNIDTLILRDLRAPSIHAVHHGIVLDDADTLSYADTLKFLIEDKGTPASQLTISAYMESVAISEKSISGDTLTLVIPSTMRTWNTRHLDVIVSDASKNKVTRSFVLEGGEFWFITNTDQTKHSNDSIKLYIVDTNNHGFAPDSFYFMFGQNVFAFDSQNINFCSYSVPLSYFKDGENVVTSAILYKNGIRQSRKWILTKTEEAGGSP